MTLVRPGVQLTDDSAGPPPMITAMKKHLDGLGYDKPRTVSKKDDQVFCFWVGQEGWFEG